LAVTNQDFEFIVGLVTTLVFGYTVGCSEELFYRVRSLVLSGDERNDNLHVKYMFHQIHSACWRRRQRKSYGTWLQSEIYKERVLITDELAHTCWYLSKCLKQAVKLPKTYYEKIIDDLGNGALELLGPTLLNDV
jgi:hypothetical protein